MSKLGFIFWCLNVKIKLSKIKKDKKMLIELSLLPPNIAEQIMQVQHGQTVQFANNGQVIAKAIKEPTLYEMIMAYDDVDVADIDLPEMPPCVQSFDDIFA